MIKHRIKQIRVTRGLSQQELGKLINKSKSVISRLEAGENLDLDIAQKIAVATNTTLAEVLGIDAAHDFTNDVSRYRPTPSDFWAIKDRAYYLVETDVLSYAGYERGMIIEVSSDRHALNQVAALAAVLVEYSSPPTRSKYLLFRQFMPPALLVTNCPRANARSIDIAKERDARIVGVVISSRRPAGA